MKLIPQRLRRSSPRSSLYFQKIIPLSPAASAAATPSAPLILHIRNQRPLRPPGSHPAPAKPGPADSMEGPGTANLKNGQWIICCVSPVGPDRAIEVSCKPSLTHVKNVQGVLGQKYSVSPRITTIHVRLCLCVYLQDTGREAARKQQQEQKACLPKF